MRIPVVAVVIILALPALGATQATSHELMDKARRLSEALEYQQVVPLTQLALRDPDLPVELRLEAYLMQGSAFAVIGDTVGAERAFRFLLRADPTFDLSANTSPKILGLFRKVQFEQRTIRAQLKELERERLVAQLRIEGEIPDEATGGVPIRFAYRLQDPRGAVASFNLHFKKKQDKNFSSVALTVGDDGKWQGEIPGEWTASEAGFAMEYYVQTADLDGTTLVTLGEARKPLQVAISAGELQDLTPIYQEAWFWPVVGTLTVALIGGGWWAYHEASSLAGSPLGEHQVE